MFRRGDSATGDDDFSRSLHLRFGESLKALGSHSAAGSGETPRKTANPDVHARVEEILAELNRPPTDDSPVPAGSGWGGGHAIPPVFDFN